MNIELGTFGDGNVMMVSDRPLPDLLKRIEYYQEQRLLTLVYHGEDHDDDLMEYEIPENMKNEVESAPNVTIYSLFPNHEPIGYKVPLIKVRDVG